MLALAASLLLAGAPTTARYTVHLELTKAPIHVVVDGSGVADGRTRLSSLAFEMRVGKRAPGDAVISSGNGLVAYVKGPTTNAPAAKPWARFRGKAAVPFFDPTVALRLRSATVPPAEARLLFPGVDHPVVHAQIWRDSRGRIVRVRAHAGTITVDERLFDFGASAAVRVPNDDRIYLTRP